MTCLCINNNYCETFSFSEGLNKKHEEGGSGMWRKIVSLSEGQLHRDGVSLRMLSSEEALINNC